MIDEDRRKLVLALRALLDRRGLTISELSRMSGVPRSTLDRALNGRGNMNADHWYRLWDSLGLFTSVVEAVVKVLDRVR